MKLKKNTKRFLVLAVALMLVSMIGTSLMQANFGRTKVSTFTGTLSELADMIRKNNVSNGKKIEITFTENNQYQFNFMMLKPPNATRENPVPAIICSHGGSNSREMQINNYIALVRRGFVVITIDAAGHGRTDNGIQGLTSDSYGMLAATEYAMSLDFVNEVKIGVTGHSMGNSSCYGTIAALNFEGSKQRISAWVEGAGSMPAVFMTEEQMKGLLWTMAVNKYDEFDSVYFNAYTILTTDLAKNLVRKAYPAFRDSVVADNQWYTPEGLVNRKENGAALGVSQGFCLLNPELTHPMFHFSKLGTAITMQGFYDAFGVPSGANYIDPNNQIWWIAVVFQFLGLIGFFMLLFPIVEIFIELPVFNKIKRPVREIESTPSIKSPKEWIPLVLTIVPLVIFSFMTFYKYYPMGDGSSAFNASVYAAGGVPNGVGIWTIICGLFVIAMIFVNYIIKKIAYGKDNQMVDNPFAPAILDNLTGFFRIVLFSFTIVAIMYIPVYIAYHVFNADFRICSLMVMSAEPNKFFIVLAKYLPMWALFYVPNAIMNANTRYKDLPDWVTTVICAVANSISLVIFICVQYSTLYSTGSLWKPAAGMGGIVAFAVAPCLAFAAFSARFVYKKTGSVWVSGLINAILMCCITCFGSTFGTDLIFPF